MLEKPDLTETVLLACLHDEYGLEGAQVDFLPLGADVNTAVYKVMAGDGTPYFLKLRGGVFDEAGVAVPRFLSEQGIAAVIAPRPTRAGQLAARVDRFAAVLYPFVVGRDGYQVALADRQRVALGAALRRIHATGLPAALANRIPRETYTPYWRSRVRDYQGRVEDAVYAEPVAAELAALMRSRRDVIAQVVGRAEDLAVALRDRVLPAVLCHGDIHAGNVLIAADGALYIVDWDTLIYAPKEHDLMFVGGGIDDLWPSPREEMLFYAGYGPAAIDRPALAYYRYERIVQDMAVICEQILGGDGGGEDRVQGLRFFASNFLPDSTIAIAYRSDPGTP